MPADPPQTPPAGRSRRIGLRLGVGAALLAAGALAVLVLQRGDLRPSAEPEGPGPAAPARGDAAPEPAPAGTVDVQVTKPTRRDITYAISLSANVAPLYQTTLYAKVAGYLRWIGPDKGDRVAKGEVLAIIDAPEVEEQYEQALSDYKIKKLTYERLARVWKESPDVIAKQDVDVAEAAFESAKNVMEQRRVLRDYTKVRAPYAGIITARFVDPGALIQVATTSATGAIPLFTIMDLDTVRVYTNVPQDEAPLVKPGTTPAVVTVKELGGRQYRGTVTRVTLALDPASRTMLAEIDLPNPDHAIQPGISAEVTLSLRQSLNTLVIPPTAIVAGGKTKAVFIVDGGVARQVQIKTGITDGRWVEVVEGLTGNEDVVVVGKSRLTDGMAVTTAPYNLPEGKPAVQKFERRSSGGTNGPAADHAPAEPRPVPRGSNAR
jgi:RND family efflux transporter MFP subunit